MPVVSVVVPVYNAAATVGETIESVLAQSFRDWELILVDDGSTDHSAVVCAAYDDPRIRMLRQENRGASGARNAGIRAAQGRYVAFLDSDDTWMPEKLTRHVDHLDAHPTLGLSFDHSLLVDSQGCSLATTQGVPGPVSAEALILDNPVGNGSAAVVRRAALDALAPDGAGFDEALAVCEDLDMWWRLVLTTPFSAAGLPDVLTRYRQRPVSLSFDTERMRLGWEHVLEKAFEYAPEAVAHLERPARARMLRYLAGRAIAARDGRTATRLLRAALTEYPTLFRVQPRQVVSTAAAAFAIRFTPAPVLNSVERFTRRLAA